MAAVRCAVGFPNGPKGTVWRIWTSPKGDADLDQPGLRAEAEDLAEEIHERRLVADPEAGDGGVIGVRLVLITRKATSSRQRRSIPRDERSPTA